ncbi:hypothetical protein ACTNCZ_13395 [Segatella copri]|uniref:hypothetical protein n=1 Tax=Segatella copri TaxID=165179 RepID=UPI003F8AD703
MKITNLDKGKTYQLGEGAKLEVERTNPFFNDYGETTTPLDIPASDYNRMILGYPDTFGLREKMVAANVSIEDGEYFAQCRQIVLSAQHKGNISSSFYINDGSFYSKIQNVKLKSIFKDEMIPGCSTLDECISFCRSLIGGKNENYDIFPVLLTDDSGKDTGYDYKILNGWGNQQKLPDAKYWRFKNTGGYEYVAAPDAYDFVTCAGKSNRFQGEFNRTEYVNEIPVSLTRGYYISPFIRANYVLKRVFKYFGYDLQENFFTQTEPFTKMVLVNNVIDVMVNGHIRIEDLLPDVSVSDFLSVFRKKFLCEFVSDEGTHQASIIFLKDAVESAPAADLTRQMTEEPTLSYKTASDYKRVVLRAKHQADSDAEDSYDDLKDMLAKNTGAYFDKVDGCFYKDGYSGNYHVKSKIGEGSQSYDTGEEDTDTQDIEIPEMIPETRTLKYRQSADDDTISREMGRFLYIGSYATLNSSMKVATEDNSESSEEAVTTPVMLAFPYVSTDGMPCGTVTAYDIHYEYDNRFGPPSHASEESLYRKIFDYALVYNGDDGIFEKFYRQYDLLLRNSLQELKVKLLLTQSQKQNLPSYAKVVIRGVSFFFNKLKFTLGGKSEPTESELRTIALTTPIHEASRMIDVMPALSCGYRWVGHEETVEVSGSEYENSGGDKDRTFKIIYPPLPSAEYVGQKYGLQKSYVSQKTRHATMFRHSKWVYHCTTAWLECVKI